MSGHTLTPQLAWFVRRHIRSLEDLEILMLLRGTADQWWTAPEIARQVSTTKASAQDSLQRLVGSFLQVRPASEPAYRFGPASPEHQQNVAELDEVYRENRADLIRFILPQPSVAIQDFADAFRLQKKDEEEEGK
jgi:hypothetical protein